MQIACERDIRRQLVPQPPRFAKSAAASRTSSECFSSSSG
jgi:hypothetical protein